MLVRDVDDAMVETHVCTVGLASAESPDPLTKENLGGSRFDAGGKKILLWDLPTSGPRSLELRTLTVKSGLTLPMTWTMLPLVRWDS